MACIKQHVLLPLNRDIWVVGFGGKQTFWFLHIEGYRWSPSVLQMKILSFQRNEEEDRQKKILHNPTFVCNLYGDGKDLQTISPGGGERERENNLIQEIPRQTKTELPKWRRDPQGNVLGTSLRIMTLLCPSSEWTSVFVPIQLHTPSSPTHDLGLDKKNEKSQCSVSEAPPRDKIYMYYCYVWMASITIWQW